MITFACASCHKQLSVRDDLAGKKARCPGCGAVTAVPGTVTAAVSPRPASTLAPAHPATLSTAPATGLAEQPTAPPPSQSDQATAPSLGAGEYETNLTDFLAPPQAPDELGRLGGFRILKVLGQGGMGVVFQAEDPKLGRQVAIKAMLPHLSGSKSGQERFLREAKAAAALEHDHIVPIFHVGEDRGAPFIVMPFLKGESLEARLQRVRRLPNAEVLRIGREIARGLAAAHTRGLIHRDIKPANIWLEAGESDATGGRVKILDFGLARASAQDSGLTQQGAIIGTPAYMAPEQARGEAVDARCDLWSLGVVLYRLGTGQLPFRGADTIATLVAVATYQPPSPLTINPQLPRALADLVMRLLEKDPARRVPSAQAVLDALRQLDPATPAGGVRQPAAAAVSREQLTPAPTRDRAETTASFPGTNGRPPRKGRKFLLAAAAVLVVAAVAVGVTVLAPWPHGEEGTGTPLVSSDPENRPSVDAPEAHLAKEFTNDLGMEFVLVPKGKSWLGGGAGKPGDRVVEILDDFYLGKYEVTQQEWEAVMGKNPSHFSRKGAGKDLVEGVSDAELKRFPVENVSWNETQEFLKRLNAQVHEPGWVYRLPKEVEWEYACRGGPMNDPAPSAYDFYLQLPQKDLSPDDANFDHPNGRKKTCQVGTFKPNALGLFDMHGNVLEWCDDSADGDEAATRVLRGGSWRSAGADLCRAARQVRERPSARNYTLGLRLARVPADKSLLAEPPRHDYALFFDKTGPVKLAPELKLHPTRAFTLEAWVTPKYKNYGGYASIMRFPNQAALQIGMSGTSWGFRLKLEDGTEPSISGGSVKAGHPVHLAAIRENNEIRLYIDGKCEIRRTIPKQAVLGEFKSQVYLGGMAKAPFVGIIDEIRISKSARYHTDFTPQRRFTADSDTLALYHCDEGKGDVLIDSSGNRHHGQLIGAKWLHADGSPIPPASDPDGKLPKEK